MEIVISIAGKIAEYTVEPIGRQLGYLFFYNSNVAKLEARVKQLEDAKLSMQHSVEEAKGNAKEIENHVQQWQIDVDGKIVDAKKLLQDISQAKMSCCNGLCPNLKLRYQLSRKAKKIAEDVVEIQKAGKFDRVSYKSTPLGIPTMASTRDYESLESRISTLHKIMDALRNDDINMIGVYGMGGVGKTTLVKEVAQHAQEEKLFDKVVMAAVTQNHNLRKIQGEIGDILGLKFEEESDEGRANSLFKRIKQEKKILVILDDLWMKLDLNKVGVPFGNDCKGCNILLTSRNQDVLYNQMGCQLNLLVGTLPEEEAWQLFKKMAGDCVENSNLQSTAVEVSKKCSSLPIAIVTVARALRDKSPPEWRNALRQLQRPNVRNVAEIPKDVYSCLELSYDYLKSLELKSIFLLCGLIDNIATIEDLLRYCFGLGLLEGIIYTMEEARDRVHTFVQQLKTSCLLLNSDVSERFMMHDVVRDVAISIASRDQYVFTVQNDEVKEWPDKDQLKNCTKISLCYSVSDMNGLPEGLECPNLEFFYMVNKDSSIKVPDSFFQRLCGLKVLNFTGMRFSSLPSSLNLLTNLQTLCLDQCELGGEIDLIGELKNLKILSLINSDIKQLPRVIGQLTHLRLLDLSKCSKLEVIPPNVISSLKKLEELYVRSDLVKWKVEGVNNASLSELKHLPSLTALEIRVRDATVLPNDFYFEKLKRYRISIGVDWWWYNKEEMSRMLELNISTNYHSQHGVKMLLNNVENLYLSELNGVTNVLYELNSKGFPLLKHLYVQTNSEIQHIINSMDWRVNRPCSAFVVLESLSLSDLSNLENICHGPLIGTSFCKLRSIQVNYCHKLKNFFSTSIAKGLLELQEINVCKCDTMEEIVAEGREEDANNGEVIQNIEFRQLRTLKLEKLPRFIGFYSKVKLSSVSQRRENQLIVDTRSKEIISEDELGPPMYLFNQKVLFPNLENLELTSLDNIEKIWHDQLPLMSSCFQNLTNFFVEWCSNLKCLSSYSMMRSLVQLKILSIGNCEVIEEILVTKESNEEVWTDKKILLRKLEYLELQFLPKLTRFCSVDLIELPSLKELKVCYCPKLKTFNSNSLCTDLTVNKELEEINNNGATKSLFNEKVVLPNLESMEIHFMDNLRMIWHDQLIWNDSFCKLKILKVIYCNSLKSLFSTFVAKHLIQLEKLEIFNCKALEDIVVKEEELGTEPNKLVFPRLISLTLCNLLELKSFYPAKYTLECPSLKVLEIYICDKVKMFASNLTVSLLDITIQQPLFWIKKDTFANLEELKNLEWNDAMNETWHGQFPAEFFPKLKVLDLHFSYSESTVFAASFVQELSNLQELSLQGDLIEEIRLYEGRFPISLRKLELDYMPKLMHWWKEDSQTGKAFQNLEELSVGHCGGLKNLEPFSLSLQNLKTLRVWGCNGLINLVTSSTAKTLVQLTEMSIEYCDNITEIVAKEGGEAGDPEIVFGQLKSLEFLCLPRLTSFHPGNCTMKFPSLEVVTVIKCLELKIFSQGVLSTPALSTLHINREGPSFNREKDDLNNIIKNLEAS